MLPGSDKVFVYDYVIRDGFNLAKRKLSNVKTGVHVKRIWGD